MDGSLSSSSAGAGAQASPLACVPSASSPQTSTLVPASIRNLGRLRLDPANTLVMAALVGCASLPYLNVLVNGFVYDDHAQVTNNPYLQNFHHLKEIFTTTVWSYVGAQGVTNYYRPMMMLGYLACYRLFGAVAYPFHLVSLTLHALVVCLLFAMTGPLTRSRAWAFATAALFALHPIHTESVAWIAAVTDLELAFFFLIAFSCFLLTARPGGARSETFAVLTVLAFALALLSKEQALMLPPLATIYEHLYRCDRGDTRFQQKLKRYGPLWLLAVAYVLFRIRYLGALAPVHQMSAVGTREVLLSALTLFGQYVGKLIWPAPLCAFYVFHPSTSLSDPRVFLGFAAVIATATLFIVLWRCSDPAIHFASFGVVWFLATLAPVLNAHWMAANVFAERYLYLPSVGFCWVAGLAASKLWESAAGVGARRTIALAGAVLAVLMAARIVTRNRDWNNDVTLYRRTLALSPDAAPILNNLGTVYWQDGNVDQADLVWKRALAITPRSAIVLNNLGLVSSRRKQYDEAVPLFQRAVAIKPNYTDPHLNLGETYRNMRMDGPAEVELRTAIALSPLNSRAHEQLGELYVVQGHLSEAEDQFHMAAQNSPNASALDALGELALRRNDAGVATSAFQAAVSLDHYDSKAHFGLARIDAAEGHTADALREYEAGLWSDPGNVEARAEVRRLRQEGSSVPDPLAPKP